MEYTVGVLGPLKANGKRWFEVTSRHELHSEATIARDNIARNIVDRRYKAELRYGNFESGDIE